MNQLKLCLKKTRHLVSDAEKSIAGKLTNGSGAVEFADIDDVKIDDLLDDLAEATLVQGGKVLVMNKEQVPGETGAAAIYRY